MPTFTFPVPNLSDVGIDKWSQAMRDNLDALYRQDQKAKEAGKLVGRFIDQPIADGVAYYVILGEVGDDSVLIHHVTGVGDDYTVNMWGEERVIEKAYAASKIDWRDTYTAWSKKASAKKK